MSDGDVQDGYEDVWRRDAPAARRVAEGLFGWFAPWQGPLAAAVLLAPLFILAGLSPALLSQNGPVETLAPFASARAWLSGASAAEIAAGGWGPAPLGLVGGASFLAGSAGLSLLWAQLAAAVLGFAAMSYLALARFSTAAAAGAALLAAASVAAPLSGAGGYGWSVLLWLAAAALAAPADEGAARLRIEGVLCGLGLFVLWNTTAAFFLAGVFAMLAAPWTGGRRGLAMLLIAAGVATALAAGMYFVAPGLNMARLLAALAELHAAPARLLASGVGITGYLGGAGAALAIVAIFAGGEEARAWVPAVLFAAVSFILAAICGANAAPGVILAALIACFSTASPFYDGVFAAKERGAVAAALGAGALSLLGVVHFAAYSTGLAAAQYEAARTAPDALKRVGLAYAGGTQALSAARWLDDGLVTLKDAHADGLFSPAVRALALAQGAEFAQQRGRGRIAILASADVATAFFARKAGAIDGRRAAADADFVLAPRFALENNSAAVNDSAEGLLFSQFRLADETPLWQVWERRAPVVASASEPASGP